MRDDPIISLESAKTTLDIPSPHSGQVVQLVAEMGDKAEEGMLLMTLERPL
jgi:pyruvate dehydrogenase E2 component (dihydrolipoamide acetyltransferase)